MARWLQVGAGSGGMVVLDLLSRDPRLAAVTLIEPDLYKPHNVPRHYFGPDAVGRGKAALAEEWLKQRRPDLEVECWPVDVMAEEHQAALRAAAARADFGVCAVDNEPAKYHWDRLMREAAKPWTLGEVLSGGIGGFIHRFEPGQACYGCVASFLKRETTVDQPPQPDYSQPGGPVHETTVPASAVSIHVIASLHAWLTLAMFEGQTFDFTSLLLTLQCVPGVFDQALRPLRLAIPRSPTCLICSSPPAPSSAEELDAQLAQALARLGAG